MIHALTLVTIWQFADFDGVLIELAGRIRLLEWIRSFFSIVVLIVHWGGWAAHKRRPDILLSPCADIVIGRLTYFTDAIHQPGQSIFKGIWWACWHTVLINCCSMLLLPHSSFFVNFWSILDFLAQLHGRWVIFLKRVLRVKSLTTKLPCHLWLAVPWYLLLCVSDRSLFVLDRLDPLWLSHIIRIYSLFYQWGQLFL